MFNKDLLNLIYSYAFERKEFKILSRNDREAFYKRITTFYHNSTSNKETKLHEFKLILNNKNLFINGAEVVLIYEILDQWHDKELRGEVFTVYMPHLKGGLVCKLMKWIYF